MDRLHLFLHIDLIVSVVVNFACITVFLIITCGYFIVAFVFYHSVQRK